MITVGVAAFNAAKAIPNLLESLLAQDYPADQMEVVVADNGSTDDTMRVVAAYAERGPIRLVRAAHRKGPAVARNGVIAAARGEIIAFTDHDCVAHPSWLARIDAGFADPEVGCVAGAILPADPQSAVERFYLRRGILSQESVLFHPFLPYVQTANAAFRSALFERVGGFDEDLITSEDADMLWRMQLHTGFRLSYSPDAIVWHRHRGTTRGMWRQAVGWGVGHAALYRKYRGSLRRDSACRLLWDWRRLAGLLGLSFRRWIGVRLGRGGESALEDAFLSLVFHGGIRFGRLKGSMASHVLYL